MKYQFLLPILLFTLPAISQEASRAEAIRDHETLSRKITRGWNTWDNRNVLSHVLLPDGFSLHLGVEDALSGGELHLAFTGNKVKGSERVRTLAHTPDGAYTALKLHWKEFIFTVQSTAAEGELDVLITPEPAALNPGWLTAGPEFLYGKTGSAGWQGPSLNVRTSERAFRIHAIGKLGSIENEKARLSLDGPLAFSTRETTLEAVRKRISAAEAAYWQRRQSFGAMGEAYNVIQNAVNWTAVYDPALDRVVTPVARTWSYGWGGQKEGGFVLFCWDNFFAAYMHAIESKELAYNEVYQLTRIIDELGFVPNYAGPGGEYSRDRSQPPVGGIMVKEVYRMHPEEWFLEANFDQLLRWNRWWAENRDIDGYLAWGSNPYEPTENNRQKTQNTAEAASFESGLDNTPMYDGVPFDTARHVLLQADVGLMSLYVADCEALAEMAGLLGRKTEAAELKKRAEHYRQKLQTLWNEEFGLFLNKRTDTGEWNYSISPTNFYPLLAKAATQEQAERMIEEHFYNPEEFWGDFILPSIARNDPGYTGRDYWRGGIWAPMNFLVYLGLRHYDLPRARADLADRSLHLLMKNWEARSQVLENYHAETGGHPGYRSEYFYNWGALLGMINLIEHGKAPPTEAPLK